MTPYVHYLRCSGFYDTGEHVAATRNLHNLDLKLHATRVSMGLLHGEVTLIWLARWAAWRDVHYARSVPSRAP